MESPAGNKVQVLRIAMLLLLTTVASAASDASFAKNTFARRCTGCHSYGRGVKVGPDLKGVTERRSRAWLLNFIRSSSKVIQARDPVALTLFNTYKRERMPDWSDLSPLQVESILDYFAAGGPMQKEPDERDASTATAAEVEAGRHLFTGDGASATRGASGATACVLCHSIGGVGRFRGGTLGPDLSTVYLRYKDKAITDYLKHSSASHHTGNVHEQFLAPQQIFEIKAYLAKAVTQAVTPATNPTVTPAHTPGGVR